MIDETIAGSSLVATENHHTISIKERGKILHLRPAVVDNGGGPVVRDVVYVTVMFSMVHLHVTVMPSVVHLLGRVKDEDSMSRVKEGPVCVLNHSVTGTTIN